MYPFEAVCPFQSAQEAVGVLDREPKERVLMALAVVLCDENNNNNDTNTNNSNNNIINNINSNALWLLGCVAERAVQGCGGESSLLLLQDTFFKRGLVVLSKMLLGCEYWTHVFGTVIDEICCFDLLLDDPALLTAYCNRVLEAMGTAPCSDVVSRVLREQIPHSIHARFFCSVVCNFLLVSVPFVRPQRAQQLSQNAMRSCMALAKGLQTISSAVSHTPNEFEQEAWTWGAQNLPALVLMAEALLSASHLASRSSTHARPGTAAVSSATLAADLAALGLSSEEAERMRFSNKGEQQLRLFLGRMDARQAATLRRVFAEEERELSSFVVEEVLALSAEGKTPASVFVSLLEVVAWSASALTTFSKTLRASLRAGMTAAAITDVLVTLLTTQSEALPAGFLNLVGIGRELRRGRSHWAALCVACWAAMIPLLRASCSSQSSSSFEEGVPASLLGPCLCFLMCDLGDAARVANAQLALAGATPLALAVERLVSGVHAGRNVPLPWPLDLSEARQLLDEQLSTPVSGLLSPKQKSRGELHPELQAVLLQQQRPKTVAITDLRGTLPSSLIPVARDFDDHSTPLYLEDLEELSVSPPARRPSIPPTPEPAYVLCAQCSAANPRGFIVCRVCKKRHGGVVDAAPIPIPIPTSTTSTATTTTTTTTITTTTTTEVNAATSTQSTPTTRRLGRGGSRVSESLERRKSIGEVDD